MEVLNEGCSLGLLVPAATVSCSFFWLVAPQQQFFVLSLTPPFSVLSFIYFRRTDFVVGLGLIFGTVSLHCLACSFFLLVALPTAFVSLSLSIFILFPCQSLVGIGIYGIGTVSLHCLACCFFLQIALLTLSCFCILSSSCFLLTAFSVLSFILRLCPLIQRCSSLINRITVFNSQN